MATHSMNEAINNDSRSPGEGDLPIISVNSLWKVFGKKPNRALEEPYRSQSRAEVQQELICCLDLQAGTGIYP